jgi:hypothetical protein
MLTVGRNRTCARARGTGHRRRYSKSHISCSSVYETIEEEMSNASSPAHSLLSKKSSPTTRQPVFVVDSDTVSINSKPEESTWDDETTLRKYYALRDEAENVVVESKPTWLDTPFSLFALQSTCISFLFPLSFTNYFHQLSEHQEVRPGCKFFLNILFKATNHYPLTSVLVVLGPHHDHPLILKVECQRQRSRQIRVALVM